MQILALAALASLAAIGCTTTPSPGTSSGVQLGEAGRLALAGDCVVVAEPGSLVCVPRVGGDAPHELVKSPDRTYVAIAADGDDVLATSVADHAVELDRVALDGTVTPLLSATATQGAGELAPAEKQVVLSTGSQLLLVDGEAGGIVATLARATGVIGAVAARAGTVYYTVDGKLQEVQLDGTAMPVYATAQTLALAADAGAVVSGDQLDGDPSYSFANNLTTRSDCELHGTVSRLALAGGHPYAIVDGAIFDAAEVVAEAPVVPATDAFDLAVDDQRIYWIARSGELDRAARP